MSRKKSINAVKMVQISISLHQELVDVIDRMAKADNRNRSNFISNVLGQLAKKKL